MIITREDRVAAAEDTFISSVNDDEGKVWDLLEQQKQQPSLSKIRNRKFKLPWRAESRETLGNDRARNVCCITATQKDNRYVQGTTNRKTVFNGNYSKLVFICARVSYANPQFLKLGY